MTAERISEARKRACKHLTLIREMREGVLTERWLCVDCPEMFVFEQLSDVAVRVREALANG